MYDGAVCSNPDGMNHYSCVCGTNVCQLNLLCKSSQNLCMTCAPGQVFQPSDQTCLTCSAGQAATTVTSACALCPVGTYQSETAATSYGCTTCAPGKYQNATGQQQCRKCAAGKYLSTAATAEFHDEASDCEDCGVLQFNPFEGLAEECYLCLTARTTASTTCDGCSPGTYKNQTGDCNTCPSGFFTAKINLRSC